MCYLRQNISCQSVRLKNYNRFFLKQNIQGFVITCSMLPRRALTTIHTGSKLVCTVFLMLQDTEILILLQTQDTNTLFYFIFHI